MIKHIVLWTFHETAEGRNKNENISIAKKMLEGLQTQIPSVIHLETGTNITFGRDAFDLALYCEFADKTGLKEYQYHAEHLKLVEFLRKVRNKHVYVDYEMEESFDPYKII